MYRNIQNLWVLVVLALTLACSEKGVTPPETVLKPVPHLSVSPSTTIFVGEELTVTWSCARATSAERSWLQSYGATTSVMGTSETLQWNTPGTYPLTITCAGDGGSAQASVTVLVKPIPTLVGRVFGFPGETWFGGLRFAALSGTTERSTDVNPQSGAFSLVNPFYNLGCIEEEIRETGLNSGYFSSLAQICSQEYETSQTFVRHPTRFKLERGEHSGFESEVDLQKAFALSGDGVFSFYYKSLLSTGFWKFSTSTIPDGVILPVAIDWQASNQPFSADVENRLAAGIDTNTLSFGKKRFSFSPISSVNGQHGVRITIDTAHKAIAGAGFATDLSGNIIGGLMVFRDTSLVLSWVIQHELGHVMGFGHTCSWSTMMQAMCGYPPINRATPEDVLSIEYFYASREAQIRAGARHSLPAAWNGVLRSLGKPPEWPMPQIPTQASTNLIFDGNNVFMFHDTEEVFGAGIMSEKKKG